ncbi:MAG: hypothetical protein WAW88_08795 [Nocardioides sp.]
MLREQAKAVEVVNICGCGCPSIDFVAGRGLGMSARVNAAHNNSDDGLFLWTIEDERNGELLGGIEWVGVSDSDPAELPDPAEITVTGAWRCGLEGTAGGGSAVDERDLERWRHWGRKYGFVRARLRLLTTDEGGRRTAILSGYRSCWGFPSEVHDEMHDGPLLIEGQSHIDPGDSAVVSLHPLMPELWPEVLPGMTLGMFEGSRQVGEAIVLELVGPEAG